MASLANANLPSDDEQDEDYAPSEEDEETKGAKKKKVGGCWTACQTQNAAISIERCLQVCITSLEAWR